MNPFDLFLVEIRQHGYEPVRAVVANLSGWERLCYNGESRSKASGGYRITENPDGSVSGNYGSSKDPAGFRFWRSGTDKELSWEEMAAQKQARESHRKYLDDRERAKQEKIGRWLARAIKSLPEAKEHPYIAAKKITPYGAKLRVKGNELIVPGYGADGKLHSIQRIKVGWKGYFPGANRRGVYLPLAKAGEDLSVLFMTEGWASGCTVREATGLPVLVCFDTGNLPKIAQLMKKKYPDSRQVFIADNDAWVFAPGKKPKNVDKDKIAGDDPRWQEWRDAGLLYNPGLDAARNAAVKIGGATVLFPEFKPENWAAKPTDANDAASLYGLEYVKNMIMAALEASYAPAPVPEIPEREEATHDGFHESAGSDLPPIVGGEAVKRNKPNGDLDMDFRVLGYNDNQYFYYPYSLRQIVALSPAAHTMNNLMQLDSLDAWESHWRGEDGKLKVKHQTIAIYAFDRLKKAAKSCGVFKEEDRVRGAGCWMDDGRIVLHCGDRLYVDGDYTAFDDLETDYTYVAAERLLRPSEHALTNHEAHRLRKICESVTWENPLSGSLLAGWLVIAPIGAALEYRPHLYLTGESQSGKSTVLNKIIRPVLGRCAMKCGGKTTEPKIRQDMGYDARPLVFDEARPSQSIAAVIDLACMASTGEIVKKFGQRPFNARFCACFSAVNPPVNKTEEENRISFMKVKKNRQPTAQQEYDDLITLIEETITSDYSERLLARTLDNMQSLLANIRIFQRAFRKASGDARASQQIGTMLAGLYLLHSTEVISENKALEWVKKYSWSDHTIVDDVGDPVRLVQHITSQLVRYKTGGEISIGELMLMKVRENDSGADRALRTYGLAVRDGFVDVASRSSNLKRLLKDTEWVERWSNTLSDVAGAVKKSSAYFSPGLKTSCVSVPLELFIEQEAFDSYLEAPVAPEPEMELEF